MLYLNSNRKAQGDDIGMRHTAEVRKWLQRCPAHHETELLSLSSLAARLGVASVSIKAEWQRMGLGSFKALGGGYAVARRAKPGITVACASAGNHGLAVAAAAKVFGLHAVIYLSHAVPEFFAEKLRAQGAGVLRSGSTYEESMANAAEDSRRKGWCLISDSSWAGYTEVPLDVMRGYTIIFDEVAAAMSPATHVFVQAGVGGLAAAAAAYLRERWGDAFQLIVVEPEGAPCLLESARQGELTRIQGSPTRLGRLDCKEPSLLAFDMLRALANAFMTIQDSDADHAATELTQLGTPVSACGAAGAAGLIVACEDESTRAALQLNAHSRVLLIGTEGLEA